MVWYLLIGFIVYLYLAWSYWDNNRWWRWLLLMGALVVLWPLVVGVIILDWINDETSGS